jgi:hypothetical protein
MARRIPKQERSWTELQTAVLDEARERARQLHAPPAGSRTDQSVTPPHGDPERAHLGPESGQPRIEDPKTPTAKTEGTSDDQITNLEGEGPGPAEGRTDNRAGG